MRRALRRIDLSRLFLLICAWSMFACAIDDGTPVGPDEPPSVIAAGVPWDDCASLYAPCEAALDALDMAIFTTMVVHVPQWTSACAAVPPPEDANCALWLSSVVANLTAAGDAVLDAAQLIRTIQREIVAPMVNEANALRVGLNIQVVNAAVVVRAATAYLRARVLFIMAYRRMAQAIAFLSQAHTVAGNDPVLLPLARPRISTLMLAAGGVISISMPLYNGCVDVTLGGIAVAALQNMVAGPQPAPPAGPGPGGGGPPPPGGPGAKMAPGLTDPNLSGTIAFDDPVFDVAFGPTNALFQMPALEVDFGGAWNDPKYRHVTYHNGWQSHRVVWVWYRVPLGLELPEILDADGQVWIPAGTPLCAVNGSASPTIDYTPGAGCAAVRGHFHSLFHEPDGGDIVNACMNLNHNGVLMPGEGTGCPIHVLPTTGTPTTIGQLTSLGGTVMVSEGPQPLGPNGFRPRWHITATAPLEGPPPGSCWDNWNSQTQRWEYNFSYPGCTGSGEAMP